MTGTLLFLSSISRCFKLYRIVRELSRNNMLQHKQLSVRDEEMHRFDRQTLLHFAICRGVGPAACLRQPIEINVYGERPMVTIRLGN